jgi:hypothetical protein
MSSPRPGDSRTERSRARAVDGIGPDEDWVPAKAEARRVQRLIRSLRPELEPEDIVPGPALEGTDR